MQEKKKSNLARNIFLVSFWPYVVLALFGLWKAISGFTVGGETYYGFYAFTSSIYLIGLMWITRIPLIPLCVLYQIGYGFWFFLRPGEGKKRK